MFALLISTVYASDTPSYRQAVAVERCLAHWGNHPFGDHPQFKVMEPSVRILGTGSRELVDPPTTNPQIVLVEPSVNIVTKTTYNLDNPNGWYCFHTNVGVLSKIVYRAHCDAHIADSRDGATVLASSETNGGVVVLGRAVIQRDCSTPRGTSVYALPAAEEEPPPDRPKVYVH